jgi:hypothetical protein
VEDGGAGARAGGDPVVLVLVLAPGRRFREQCTSIGQCGEPLAERGCGETDAAMEPRVNGKGGCW